MVYRVRCLCRWVKLWYEWYRLYILQADRKVGIELQEKSQNVVWSNGGVDACLGVWNRIVDGLEDKWETEHRN